MIRRSVGTILVALLLVLGWIGSAYSVHLQCNKNEMKEMTVESTQTDMNYEGESKFKHSVLLRGKVLLSCLKSFETSEEEDILMWYMKIKDVEQYNIVERAGMKVQKDKVSTKKFKMGEPMIFSQSISGAVQNVFHDKKENVHQATLKKGLIEMLQTKTSPGCTVRTIGMGKINVCYDEREIKKDGKAYTLISGQATEKDLREKIGSGKQFSTRRDTLKYNHYVTMNEDGQVLESSFRTETKAGANREAEAHSEFAKLKKKKNVDYQQKEEMSALDKFGGGTPVNVDQEGFFRVDKNLQRHEAEDDFDERDQFFKLVTKEYGNLDQVIEFANNHPDMEVGDLRMAARHAKELQNEAKERLKKEINFYQLLAAFKKDQSDMEMFSDLGRYASIIKPNSEKLFKYCYGGLKSKKEKMGSTLHKQWMKDEVPYGGVTKDFLMSCQGLLSAIGTHKAQEQIIKSMSLSLSLMDHGMKQFAYLKKKPSHKVIKLLQDFRTEKSFESRFHFMVEEHVFRHFKNQAYLVLGAATRMIPKKEAKALISLLVEDFNKAVESGGKSQKILVAHVLENAGGHIPTSTITNHFKDEDDVHVLNAYVNAFRRHRSLQSPATLILSTVAADPTLHPSVRAEAVNAQMAREKEIDEDLGYGLAHEYFRTLIYDPTVPKEVHHSLIKYFEHEGTENAASVLTQIEQKHSDYNEAAHQQRYKELFETSPLWWGGFDKSKAYPHEMDEQNSAQDYSQHYTGMAHPQQSHQYTDDIDTETLQEGAITGLSGERVSDDAVQVQGMPGKAKQIIQWIKWQFSKVKYGGPRTCFHMPKIGKKLCANDPSMVAFLRKMYVNGGMAEATMGDGNVNEILLGVNLVNFYGGLATGLFSGIECHKEDARVQYALFARADLRFSLMQKPISLLTAEAYSTMKAPKARYRIRTELDDRKLNQPVLKQTDMPSGAYMDDRVYFRVIGIVLIDSYILPPRLKRLLEYCGQDLRPIGEPKVWKPIFKFSINIPIYCVSLSFGMSAHGGISLHRHLTLCPTRLHISAGVYPTFFAGLRVHGGVSVIVVYVGVWGSGTTYFQLRPSAGLYGCQFCLIIGQRLRPLNIKIGIKISAVFINIDAVIVSFGLPEISSDLFRLCLPLPIKGQIGKKDESLLRTLEDLETVYTGR